MALFYSGRPEYRQALCRGLEFLVWHLALQQEAEIRSLFYHGHNTVKELLVLSELGLALSERPVGALVEWLSEMYCADEAHFSYPAKRPTTSSPGRVRYHLYHLAEDDWLTYYATRIAVNLQACAARSAIRWTT
jgi:hypothetical protein